MGRLLTGSKKGVQRWPQERGWVLSFLAQVSIHHYQATPWGYKVNTNRVSWLSKHNAEPDLQSPPNQIANSKLLSDGKRGASFDLRNYMLKSLRLNAPRELELCLLDFASAMPNTQFIIISQKLLGKRMKRTLPSSAVKGET